jgi:Uma2 family endonuclease
MSRPTATHWTYEDLLRMPDEGDGKRYEIVGGVRFMTPSPFERHQRASGNLEYLLRRYLEGRDLGVVYDAPLDVVLSDDTVLVPDIVFVSKARVSIIEQRGIFAAPDLVVEILSEGTKRRDRGIKLRAYAEHGVREYWILDPVHRSVEIFVLEGGDLVKSFEHTAGKVSSPIVLPGFSAALDRIFGTAPGV